MVAIGMSMVLVLAAVWIRRKRLEESPIRSIVVTDSIPIPESQRIAKLEIVSVAPLLANAIRWVARESSEDR